MARIAREEQAIALAAVLHYCQLVDQLARTGTVPVEQLRIAMVALLEQNPNDAASLYQGTANLRSGIEFLERLLCGERRALSAEVMRYAVNVLYLQRRLQHDPANRARIYAGIARAAEQADLFSPSHDNVLANLAQIYQDTLGRYSLRIQVRGESGYLQQPAVATRVRCLLFAAIRSAVLWHQLGGRRWHLFVHRRQLVAQLRELQRRP
ncbi:MAG: high frequency lysogenization protein HflD [Gammaproteobacteria bacterium]|nr:high frequency lysogenization protein HflD [Gammaproteobacteria bacterium]